MNIPIVSSNRSVSFELQDGGRVLVLKDAFLNPETNLYHDIKLVRQGWSFLGVNWGGEGTFAGIDEEAVRQIQKTYGIVLKTLQGKLGAVAFSGTPKKTTFVVESDAGSSWFSARTAKVLTSYPIGKKKSDIFLSKEDAAHYKRGEMTLHDAVSAGIWNRGSWRQTKPMLQSEKGKEGSEPPVMKRSVKEPRKKEHLAGFRREKNRAQDQANSSSDREMAPPTKRERKSAKNQLQEAPAHSEKPNGSIKENFKGQTAETGALSKKGMEEGISKEKGADFESAQATQRSDQSKQIEDIDTATRVQKGSRRKEERAEAAGERDDSIRTFLPIPVYRAKSTPVEMGYDDAPFDERKKRIIAHLDRASPIPFSAFVDGNLDKKIDPVLFRKMVDAIRRLAKDPEANDADAKYMKSLFRLWFRAAFHYLDKNSKPGDGYEQILTKISDQISNPQKARLKAKELYWRRHATLFWMTLVDLFAAEQIGIDRLHHKISTKTSINSWFFN